MRGGRKTTSELQDWSQGGTQCEFFCKSYLFCLYDIAVSGSFFVHRQMLFGHVSIACNAAKLLNQQAIQP